jgi:hypothetical protein
VIHVTHCNLKCCVHASLTPVHTLHCNNKHQEYAGFVALLYPLGVPLLYAVVLCKERRLAWQAQHAAASYAPPVDTVAVSDFLWEPYELRVYYWEVIECVRRLLLTGLLAFILPGSAGQSVHYSFLHNRYLWVCAPAQEQR